MHMHNTSQYQIDNAEIYEELHEHYYYNIINYQSMHVSVLLIDPLFEYVFIGGVLREGPYTATT